MTNRFPNGQPERRLTGIVILHGFTANLESVRPLFGPLGRFDLKIATPLLSGHGGSSPDALRGVTWQAWLDDAKQALDSVTGTDGKTVVLGHSMGALLAMQLAARHPELVDSIILATPPVRLTSLLGPGRPLHLFAPLVSRFVDRWGFSPTFADPANSIIPVQYDWAPTRTILSMFDLVEETMRIAGRVRVPALILHARNETVVRPESADLVYRAIATPPEQKSIDWFERTDHQIFCDCERTAAIEAAVRFVANRLNSKQHNP